MRRLKTVRRRQLGHQLNWDVGEVSQARRHDHAMCRHTLASLQRGLIQPVVKPELTHVGGLGKQPMTLLEPMGVVEEKGDRNGVYVILPEPDIL